MRIHQKTVLIFFMLILATAQILAQELTLEDAWQIALQKMDAVFAQAEVTSTYE